MGAGYLLYGDSMKTKQISIYQDIEDIRWYRKLTGEYPSDLVICKEFIDKALGYCPDKVCLTISFDPLPHSFMGFVILDEYFNLTQATYPFGNLRMRHIFTELCDLIKELPDYDFKINRHTPVALYVVVTPII